MQELFQKHQVCFFFYRISVTFKYQILITNYIFSFFLGGLLICLPRQEAALFCEELELLENRRAWIIGEVLAGSGTAQIVESPRIAECPDVDTVGALW